MESGTELTYGQIFKYEFHKADASSVDDAYQTAAMAVIAEFKRRSLKCQEITKKPIIRIMPLPSAEKVAEMFFNYLPGARWNHLADDTKEQWVKAAENLLNELRGIL